ncbi:uncharacterized protein LOC129753117 [Uranotaenia lowii]|uniref:uncharacterized protein LOC129753117 n=1 Tax=Uranotaenia lowii TaxID=190385 RepID=UPI0024788D60|nr:uncharacterized protein LOC129753117 [Uranotaenia lowii]
MVGNLYGAGLASIMTIPQYEKPIDTGRDFAESNMLLAGSAISWIYAIMDAPQPFLQKIVENYRLVDIDYMIDHRYALDIGYIGERTQFGNFGPIDFLDEGSASLMRLLKDDLFWQMCTAIVSKTWPLKHHFNKLVLAVKESGIQNYWELQVVKNFMNSKIQQGILDSRNTNQGSEAETLRGKFGNYLPVPSASPLMNQSLCSDCGACRPGPLIEDTKVSLVVAPLFCEKMSERAMECMEEYSGSFHILCLTDPDTPCQAVVFFVLLDIILRNSVNDEVRFQHLEK